MHSAPQEAPSTMVLMLSISDHFLGGERPMWLSNHSLTKSLQLCSSQKRRWSSMSLTVWSESIEWTRFGLWNQIPILPIPILWIKSESTFCQNFQATADVTHLAIFYNPNQRIPIPNPQSPTKTVLIHLVWTFESNPTPNVANVVWG